MNRYQRHIQLAEIGEKGQQKLKQAKILVVGAGGLGCPALQYLAAAGIGLLGVIDPDRVSLSNLHRQVLFAERDLGENKAFVAKERLQAMNSAVEVKAFPTALSFTNCMEILSEFDLILDASDNFVTRYLINDACVKLGKPMIHGSLYKFEGQVGVFNYHDGPSYRCLFPVPPQKGDVPNCNEVGVLGVLPGIIGTLQAAEAIKLILGIGEPLSGKILHYNLLSHEQRIFSFDRNQKEIDRIKKANLALVETGDCQFGSQISLTDLSPEDAILWIDVREEGEQPELAHAMIQKIPLSKLESQIGSLPDHPKKILFCQSGNRSLRALAILRDRNHQEYLSLSEGAEELQNWIKK